MRCLDCGSEAVTERPEALGEIIQQHDNFQTAYLQLLNISHKSYPQISKITQIEDSAVPALNLCNL